VEGSTRRSYTQEEKWIRQRKLPVDLQHYIRLISDYDHNEGAYKNQKQIQARGILDYIASMTEDEFDDMHARLTRGSRLSSMPAGRLD
jgi:dGTP triphosphohydrolase